MIQETKLYSIFIEIKGVPPGINKTGRLHWAVKTRIVNEWKNLVILAVGLRRPETPLEKAEIIYTRYSAIAMDFDNLVSSYKAVQDGLVSAGILVDDKVKNIGHPRYMWSKCANKDSRITIEVREVKSHQP